MMIYIWNRREVYSGFSSKDFNHVCDKLDASKINYKYKLVNRNNSSIFDTNRSRLGTLGEQPNLAYEYQVFVDKKDYEEACYIIR